MPRWLLARIWPTWCCCPCIVSPSSLTVMTCLETLSILAKTHCLAVSVDFAVSSSGNFCACSTHGIHLYVFWVYLVMTVWREFCSAEESRSFRWRHLTDRRSNNSSRLKRLDWLRILSKKGGCRRNLFIFYLLYPFEGYMNQHPERPSLYLLSTTQLLKLFFPPRLLQSWHYRLKPLAVALALGASMGLFDGFYHVFEKTVIVSFKVFILIKNLSILPRVILSRTFL